MLRIGNPAGVNDKMLSFTYERRFESHPLYSELWSIRKAIRETSRKRHERINELKDRATQIEIQINEDLFPQASCRSLNAGQLNHRVC